MFVCTDIRKVIVPDPKSTYFYLICAHRKGIPRQTKANQWSHVHAMQGQDDGIDLDVVIVRYITAKICQ